MSKPNPYAWITAMTMERIRREQEAAQQPRLTLVTENERTFSMSTPTDQTLLNMPLHKHGTFDDMGAAINLLALGADALKGIGAMMLPSMIAHDEQLSEVRRSDISAIFRFFGEVLSEPAQHASDAAQRLEWDVENKR